MGQEIHPALGFSLTSLHIARLDSIRGFLQIQRVRIFH